PEPIYHLMHRLFRRLDQIKRRNKRNYEHLKLMIYSDDIPSEPDTPSETSEKKTNNPETETHLQRKTEQTGTEQAAPQA
ncbi:hypothetical protein DQE84_19400, partial [Staphylococcus warneri]